MAQAYTFFTSKEIKPQGWMRRQLEIQAQGLCGNLDKVWPDVRDSRWIGGASEGWERVPYWLDGFIPMAYLLDDEDMKARAKKYIDHILAAQEEDGWICPNGDTPREQYDNWAVQLISKTLTVYYDCSGDERIPDAVYRMMKNYYDLLKSGGIKLFQWGKYRWYESFVALNWLKTLYPNEAWIEQLAHILKEQGIDYAAKTDLWIRPLNRWTLDTHIVNLMMMLKAEAISCDLCGDPYRDVAENFYRLLKKHNGTPVELMTGDECLSGRSPIQGTELCAVVEQMYSYEWLYAYTGERKWAERLEMVAFNALPATISDDMWTHQYVQMSNQIDARPFPGKSLFRTNGSEAHLFGLEPNFGCCTANFGQGWPKLAIASFMKAKDGVVSAVSVPTVLSVNWQGVPVTVSLETSYPFRNHLVYRIQADADTQMKLHVRVPSFAKDLTVNGKSVRKQSMLTFGGFVKGETVIEITFDAEATFVARPYRLYHVKYGSLVFSLPIKEKWNPVEYEKNGVERKFPYCDYHVEGVSDWNYGFADRALTVEARGSDAVVPFSSQNPPLVIHANLSHINWGLAEGYEHVCDKTPQERKPLDAAVQIALYPYGCAKLRMTEMPILS